MSRGGSKKRPATTARALQVAEMIERGLKYREVAERLKIPEGSIRSLLDRAQEVLDRPINVHQGRPPNLPYAPGERCPYPRCHLLLPCEGPHLGIDYYASERRER